MAWKLALGNIVSRAPSTPAVSGPPTGAEAVVWTSLVGVTASGNSLTKTASGIDWGNAGAISSQQIASGDGYVEVTASEANTHRMFGLSNGNTDAGYQDIDFAFYQDAGAIRIYEAGVLKGYFGTYASGDKLRVSVTGGVVTYSKNGTTFYTSTKTPTFPLLVDAALKEQGATLNSAVISGVSAPATEDPLYPLSDLGNGHPDEPARFLFKSDGVYAATFDLNLLATSSDRTDAPSGWRDLALFLAGTPGISANPPEWGTWASRANSLKLYRPSFQDVDVMPGEDVLFECGLYRPAASDATGAKLIIMNLATGEKWDGTADEWNDDADATAEQSTDDTWLDVSETLTNESDERVTYRVIVMPTGGTGASYYVYVSAPSFTVEQDFVALVGHNIPAGATATWSDGTVTATFSPISYPTTFETFTASKKRTWTLTITMPANTKDWLPAPFIGELWAGRLVDLTACPIYPFDVVEGDLGQIRVEGGLGHEAVYTESERPNRLFTMKFKETQAGYENVRDDFLRACRFGADPVMLVPTSNVETAGSIWHGRVSPEVTYSLINRTRRTFEVKLRESPFPRFRR